MQKKKKSNKAFTIEGLIILCYGKMKEEEEGGGEKGEEEEEEEEGRRRRRREEKLNKLPNEMK
jgi:hypothetical protein